MIHRLRVLLLFIPLSLVGCETAGYYRQAVAGQVEIVRKSRPIGPILADPHTDPKLRRQLAAVQEMRAFASSHLGLPGQASYGKYADLGRKSVVWSVVAAPEFSLKAKTWHYPLLGDLEYRGFFQKDAAEALGARLRQQGYDVHVGGVDAYSTLGWFHDPILNTFVNYKDVDMAELIFHELTHRRLFRNGQTQFNEALATTVSEVGVCRWLAYHGRTADLQKYQMRLVRRREFFHKLDATRQQLEALYASDLPVAEKRAQKARLLTDLQSQFREMRRRWGGRGQSDWLTQPITNAHLVSVSAYHRHIPTFQHLLDDCGGDLDEFFRRAARLRIP